MHEGMLHIRDVEGPKKTGSMETRLEAMEQQVFKCQGIVERGLNANHMMITEFTNKHRIDANDIGKHLSRLYDRVDQLQGHIYDLHNQNYEPDPPHAASWGLNGMRGFRGGHSPGIDALFLPEPKEKEPVHLRLLLLRRRCATSLPEHPPPAVMAGGSSSKKTSSHRAWLSSEICGGRVEALRHRRMLPPASQVSVRIPGAETAPTPEGGEIVVFNEHFYKGFGLPASPFFSNWLNFFGLQPHHLVPTAILQLSAFVILCEGFLGIEPRLDLWRSLFFFK
ncbi:40S ribosomal protein S5-1 [Hordeum vulgare]|nr:40S ribosomal protein S5-1 [Hordeum vulgare]